MPVARNAAVNWRSPPSSGERPVRFDTAAQPGEREPRHELLR